MAGTVSIEDLVEAVDNELYEYVEELEAEAQQLAKKKAKQAAEALRKSSPKDRGDYAEGWTTGKGSDEKHVFGQVVHNKKYWPLTHLLEDGHQLRQGGRSPAIPHIGPVDEKYTAEYAEEMEEVLSRGG